MESVVVVLFLIIRPFGIDGEDKKVAEAGIDAVRASDKGPLSPEEIKEMIRKEEKEAARRPRCRLAMKQRM